MATPGRESSLDHHLLERLKYGGDRSSKPRRPGIVVGLKNKYGITRFEAVALGYPAPSALTVRYDMDSMTINKIASVSSTFPGSPR
jgi:hypothetical protein